MRLDINLAREPFRNRSLLWLGLGVAYFIVFAVGLFVVARAGVVDQDTDELKAEVQKQAAEIKQLEATIKQRQDDETVQVLTDQDRVALEDAHALIARKSLSWTQLLSELERYVPPSSKLANVTISAVEGRGAERVAHLTVAAVGKDAAQAHEMLSNFDRSGGRFSAEPVSISPVGETSEVSYELQVDYRPAVGSSAPLGAAPAPAAREDGDDE